MRRLAPVLLTLGLAVSAPARAAEEAATPPGQPWSWHGVFGTYDRAELRRGLQVYREVCSACHGLRHVRFRDLEALGLGAEQVKALAAQYIVPGEPDEFGDPTEGPAKPHHAFPDPFPNPQAARASNNGALPPDLSLMAKARKHGSDYIYALIALGYGEDAEPDEAGLYRNSFMSGGSTAMTPPLVADMLDYPDGTPATVERMARDVGAFLMWAAEPKLEARKALGFRVVLFLLVLTGLIYVCKRKIWAGVGH